MKRLGLFAPTWRWLIVVALVASATALAACGSDGKSSDSADAKPASGSSTTAGSGGCKADGPIKIGGVGGLTGAIPVAEGTEGATAYFNELNAKGGLCGQKIDYKVVDDKGDPQASATAARQLVLRDGVVGMVNESFIDCAVNDKFYRAQKIKITGVGVNPACYTSPVFAMANNGPTGSLLGNLFFASSKEGLGKTKVCAELLRLPGFAGQFQKARQLWEQETGLKMTLYDNTLAPTSDPTSYILKAKKAGCEAVALVGNFALVPPWMKAVQAQGAGKIAWLWPAPNYVQSLPKTLGEAGNGNVYSDPEMEPDITNPDVQHVQAEVAKLNPKNGVTNMHEGGWVSALVIAEAIKSINGDVTRKSLSDALENLPPVENPFMGGPFTFGKGDSHFANHWIKEAQIKDGKWQVISKQWLEIPKIAELYSSK
ncbi:MAG: branched-chain amino acid transporter substrate-binding protein [Conexibacter sp.]|nr:branched-chain amino acid transporter substrate-binding protein [Conexibacter sp.]